MNASSRFFFYHTLEASLRILTGGHDGTLQGTTNSKLCIKKLQNPY